MSLAVADITIGMVSMPLYTVFVITGYWPFGPILCDIYLALDYLMSNASVLNLLAISLDRYFSVTRPLTYRASRTPKKAGMMIALAWIVSLLVWPPWIFAYPYIEGKRTVPNHDCYIQFIKSNPYLTTGTAIAAFYLPVTVMSILYWRVWRETQNRQKDLSYLQAGKNVSKKSSSSDEGSSSLRGTKSYKIVDSHQPLSNANLLEVKKTYSVSSGLDHRKKFIGEKPPSLIWRSKTCVQNCWSRFANCFSIIDKEIIDGNEDDEEESEQRSASFRNRLIDERSSSGVSSSRANSKRKIMIALPIKDEKIKLSMDYNLITTPKRLLDNQDTTLNQSLLTSKESENSFVDETYTIIIRLPDTANDNDTDKASDVNKRNSSRASIKMMLASDQLLDDSFLQRRESHTFTNHHYYDTNVVTGHPSRTGNHIYYRRLNMNDDDQVESTKVTSAGRKFSISNSTSFYKIPLSTSKDMFKKSQTDINSLYRDEYSELELNKHDKDDGIASSIHLKFPRIMDENHISNELKGKLSLSVTKDNLIFNGPRTNIDHSYHRNSFENISPWQPNTCTHSNYSNAFTSTLTRNRGMCSIDSSQTTLHSFLQQETKIHGEDRSDKFVTQPSSISNLIDILKSEKSQIISNGRKLDAVNEIHIPSSKYNSDHKYVSKIDSLDSTSLKNAHTNMAHKAVRQVKSNINEIRTTQKNDYVNAHTKKISKNKQFFSFNKIFPSISIAMLFKQRSDHISLNSYQFKKGKQRKIVSSSSKGTKNNITTLLPVRRQISVMDHNEEFRTPQFFIKSQSLDKPKSPKAMTSSLMSFNASRRTKGDAYSEGGSTQPSLLIPASYMIKSEKSRKRRIEKKQDKKAAKTLTAILLAFIITWTPYNILVLIGAFCLDCVPEALWAFSYYLCYINSTVNPVCYAMCNANFRRNFKKILCCQFSTKKKHRHHPNNFFITKKLNMAR
ncbi:unnamed protein product [Gordionus sp. m RMFG-2023]